MLYVPPSQIGVGLQHEGDYSRDQWCGARGAPEGVGGVAHVVTCRSDDVSGRHPHPVPGGWRGYEDVRAGLGVPGLLPVVVYRGYRYRLAHVRIPIVVRVVIVGEPVPGGPDVYAAEAVPSVHRTGLYRGDRQGSGSG